MARKRIELFKKQGPRTQEARDLAVKVFGLQKRLGISNEQMGAEIGMKSTQISALKSSWVNRKLNYKFMYPTIANRLIKFWNAHLICRKHKSQEPKGGKPAQVAEQPKSGKKRDEVLFLVEVLVKKVGFAEARALLEKEGKVARYHEYIMTLDPEKIAKLI